MRLGIFGGSFDPVHYGHLLLAECCREQRSLDQVWFLPTAVSPHKRPEEVTPARDRVAMLRLAIGGHEAFQVSTLETDRGGVNYTADSLAALAAQQPEAELFFLLGADALRDLPGWRQPQRICELATLVAVGRPGAGPLKFEHLRGIASPERIARFEQHQVEMPQVDFSGSDLRRRVAAGLSIRYRTPRAVEKYIETAGLYRQA